MILYGFTQALLHGLKPVALIIASTLYTATFYENSHITIVII